MRLGKPENRFDRMGQRIKNMLVEVVTQRCSLKSVTRKDWPGSDTLCYSGASAFSSLSYIIFIGLAGGFGLSPVLTGNTFERVFSSILDIAGLLVIIAIVWAAIRRYIVRPERLEMSAEAGIIMVMVFALCCSILASMVSALQLPGYTTNWPPVGGALARFTIRYRYLDKHDDSGLPEFMVAALCLNPRLYGLYSPLQTHAHSCLHLQYHLQTIGT